MTPAERRDVLDRDLLVAALGEQRVGGVEDLVAPRGGVEALVSRAVCSWSKRTRNWRFVNNLLALSPTTHCATLAATAQARRHTTHERHHPHAQDPPRPRGHSPRSPPRSPSPPRPTPPPPTPTASSPSAKGEVMAQFPGMNEKAFQTIARPRQWLTGSNVFTATTTTGVGLLGRHRPNHFRSPIITNPTNAHRSYNLGGQGHRLDLRAKGTSVVAEINTYGTASSGRSRTTPPSAPGHGYRDEPFATIGQSHSVVAILFVALSVTAALVLSGTVSADAAAAQRNVCTKSELGKAHKGDTHGEGPPPVRCRQAGMTPSARPRLAGPAVPLLQDRHRRWGIRHTSTSRVTPEPGRPVEVGYLVNRRFTSRSPAIVLTRSSRRRP